MQVGIDAIYYPIVSAAICSDCFFDGELLAVITVTNLETGATRTVTTDESGVC